MRSVIFFSFLFSLSPSKNYHLCTMGIGHWAKRRQKSDVNIKKLRKFIQPFSKLTRSTPCDNGNETMNVEKIFDIERRHLEKAVYVLRYGISKAKANN
jgi:hypothetical protein